MSMFFVAETTLGQELPFVDGGGPTWLDVKQSIADEGGPPVDLNDLYYEDQLLNDDDLVLETDIEPGDTLTVDVRSGVVTYAMTTVAEPPADGGDNVAHLRSGDLLIQVVEFPIEVGAFSSFELSLSLRGDLEWSVELWQGEADPIAPPFTGLFSGTDDPDLTAVSDRVFALAETTAALLTFTAQSAVLFDLVSLSVVP